MKNDATFLPIRQARDVEKKRLSAKNSCNKQNGALYRSIFQIMERYGANFTSPFKIDGRQINVLPVWYWLLAPPA